MPSSLHPSVLSLERFADGDLPVTEARGLREHLTTCRHCSEEINTFRKLGKLLDNLPRFAPSAAFADAVMARVRVAPEAAPVWAAIRATIAELLPNSRRGWLLLGTVGVAPAMVLIAVVGMMLLEPTITPSVLWQWIALRAEFIGQGAFDRVAQSLDTPGTWNLIGSAWTIISAIPLAARIGGTLLLALGGPLSAWSLIKLTRAPGVRVTYAN